MSSYLISGKGREKGKGQGEKVQGGDRREEVDITRGEWHCCDLTIDPEFLPPCQTFNLERRKGSHMKLVPEKLVLE